MPPTWGSLSVAARREDPASTLALYHEALALRRARDAFKVGGFAWLDGPLGSLVLSRSVREETVVCAVNLAAPPLELPEGELLLASGPVTDGRLPPDTAAWVRAR